MNTVASGFLQGVNSQLPSNGSILGFIDNRRERDFRSRAFDETMNYEKGEADRRFEAVMQELGIRRDETDSRIAVNQSIANSNNAGARNTDAQTAGQNITNAANQTVLDNSIEDRRLQFAGNIVADFQNRALAHPDIDNKSPDALMQFANTAEGSELLAQITMSDPDFLQAIAENTGLDPTTVQLVRVDDTGNMALQGTSTKNGKPTFLTSPGGQLAGNGEQEGIVPITGQDLMLPFVAAAARRGDPSLAQYKNLIGDVPLNGAEQLGTLRSQTTNGASLQQLVASNQGNIRDSVIDAGTGNAGTTPNSAGFQRTETSADNNLARNEVQATNEFARRETALNSNYDRTANMLQLTSEIGIEEAIQSEAIRQIATNFDDPNRVLKLEQEAARAVDAEETRAFDDAFNNVILPIATQLDGDPDTFFAEFEAWSISANPQENIAYMQLDLRNTIHNPDARKLMAEHLGIPADHNRWNHTDREIAMMAIAHSRRLGENRFDFGTGVRDDVDQFGTVTLKGIEAAKRGTPLAKKRGFKNP